MKDKVKNYMEANKILELKKENKLNIDFIDFSNCENSYHVYEGGVMDKRSIVYNDHHYMLKLQEKEVPKHYIKFIKDISKTYYNSIFSEYIASHIAKIIGLNSHETLLGYILENDTFKNVVACKNFLNDDERLITIKNIFELHYKTNEKNKKQMETLDGIIEFLKDQEFYPNKEELKKFFWNMFVFDAYIGNFDRNYKNWGIIYNVKTKDKKIAPIYDNASCLHPRTPRFLIKKYLNNSEEIFEKSIDMPTMSFKSGFFKNEEEYKTLKRMSYRLFFEHSLNEDFLIAINEIVPKIIHKHEEIKNFIKNLNVLEKERKELLIFELDLKIDYIFKPVLARATKYFINKNNDNKDPNNILLLKEIDNNIEKIKKSILNEKLLLLKNKFDK